MYRHSPHLSHVRGLGSRIELIPLGHRKAHRCASHVLIYRMLVHQGLPGLLLLLKYLEPVLLHLLLYRRIVCVWA